MDTEARTDARMGNPQGAATAPQLGTGQSDGRQTMSYRTMEIREVRPRGDETKLSIRTSEFWIYLASVGAILIASEVVGINAHHNDYFRADRAWFLIALVTIGYLVSRGIAKAGSSTRSKDTGDRQMGDGRSMGDGRK
jgi:hypothetical protein